MSQYMYVVEVSPLDITVEISCILRKNICHKESVLKGYISIRVVDYGMSQQSEKSKQSQKGE